MDEQEAQGSLFDELNKPLEEVLRRIRSDLEPFPQAPKATITIVESEELSYMQPSTDYDVLVLFEEVEKSDLERIADALPKRFEHEGAIYTVHVEDAYEHLRTHLGEPSG